MAMIHEDFDVYVRDSNNVVYRLSLIETCCDGYAVRIMIPHNRDSAVKEFPGSLYEEAVSLFELLKAGCVCFQNIINNGFIGFYGELRDKYLEKERKLLPPFDPIPVPTFSTNTNAFCSFKGCFNACSPWSDLCSYHYHLQQFPVSEPEIKLPESILSGNDWCPIDNCTNKSRLGAKGLCGWHYNLKRKGLPMDTPKRARGRSKKLFYVGPCSIEGCKNKPYKHNPVCYSHFCIQTKVTCLIAGCSRPAICHGFCQLHDSRQRKGRPLEAPLRGTEIKICTIAGCNNHSYSKSMCRAHYLQDLRSKHKESKLRQRESKLRQHRIVELFTVPNEFGSEEPAGPVKFHIRACIRCGTAMFDSTEELCYGCLQEKKILILIEKNVTGYLSDIVTGQDAPAIFDIDSVAIESEDSADEWHETSMPRCKA